MSVNPHTLSHLPFSKKFKWETVDALPDFESGIDCKTLDITVWTSGKYACDPGI